MNILRLLFSLTFVSLLSAIPEKAVKKDIHKVHRDLATLSYGMANLSVVKSDNFKTKKVQSQQVTFQKSTPKKSTWLSYKQQASGLTAKEFAAAKRKEKGYATA
jgi:hypothetical protein